jgi:hypothetical protein
VAAAGRRRRAVAAAATAVAAALVVAGCAGSVQTLDFPSPPSTAGASAPAPTLPADLAAHSETGVAGATTTTTVALGPGTAAITGTVIGPGGPIPEATVQIQRLVGSQVGATLIESARGGSFRLIGILGGRYRVRAWKIPSLAMTAPQIFFLDDGATQALILRPARFAGVTVASAFAPDPAVSGQPTTVVVEVTRPTVTADGFVRYRPATDRSIQLVGRRWTVSGAGTRTKLTNAEGQASFVAACGPVGRDPLSAMVSGLVSVPLTTPPCEPAPVSTTLPPSTTTTVATTTTTLPPKAASTTTTTGP